MSIRVLLFSQPGCLSCELTKMILQAKEIVFEERDISIDLDARREMTEQLDMADREHHRARDRGRERPPAMRPALQ